MLCAKLLLRIHSWPTIILYSLSFLPTVYSTTYYLSIVDVMREYRLATLHAQRTMDCLLSALLRRAVFSGADNTITNNTTRTMCGQRHDRHS